MSERKRSPLPLTSVVYRDEDAVCEALRGVAEDENTEVTRERVDELGAIRLGVTARPLGQEVRFDGQSVVGGIAHLGVRIRPHSVG